MIRMPRLGKHSCSAIRDVTLTVENFFLPLAQRCVGRADFSIITAMRNIGCLISKQHFCKKNYTSRTVLAQVIAKNVEIDF